MIYTCHTINHKKALHNEKRYIKFDSSLPQKNVSQNIWRT